MTHHLEIDYLSTVKATITGRSNRPSKKSGLSTGLHGAFLNLKQSEPCLAWGIQSFVYSALMYGSFFKGSLCIAIFYLLVEVMPLPLLRSWSVASRRPNP